MQQPSDQFTAIHEAGHATVAEVLPNIRPLRVSIVPFGTNRGCTEFSAKATLAGARDSFVTLAAGMAAEDLAYGEFSPMGARVDLHGMRALYRERSTGDLGWGIWFRARQDSRGIFTPHLPPDEAAAFDTAFLMAREIILQNLQRYCEIYDALIKYKVFCMVALPSDAKERLEQLVRSVK